MYLLNRGYAWKIDEGLSVDNVIITASTLSRAQLVRRRKEGQLSGTSNLLFDPQLYFPVNLRDKCSGYYCNLATYEWFNSTPPEFNSTEMNITEFNKNIKDNQHHQNIDIPIEPKEVINRIRKCLDFQNSISTTYLILPVPLVKDIEDQFNTQLLWINEGIDISKEYEKPCLVTLAISDNVLLHRSMEKNNLVSTIIDNLSALENIDGFYIVVSRSDDNPRIINNQVVKFILELSYILGHILDKKVFLNFIDDLALLGIAVGAYGFGSGYVNKETRLNFTDYIDRNGGGGALPHFYSHNLIGDFLSSRDMNKIKDKHLFKYFKGDETTFSQPLFDTLNSGQEISPLWKETRNNITYAKNHRIELMKKKCSELANLEFKKRIDYCFNWLLEAEAGMLYLNNRFEKNALEETGTHIPIWRNAFEEFIKENSLL